MFVSYQFCNFPLNLTGDRKFFHNLILVYYKQFLFSRFPFLLHCQNKCHSELILKEEMPIVQLNYAHKILIISTYSRTVLCHTDENYRLQQVGQRPRKRLVLLT